MRFWPPEYIVRSAVTIKYVIKFAILRRVIPLVPPPPPLSLHLFFIQFTQYFPQPVELFGLRDDDDDDDYYVPSHLVLTWWPQTVVNMNK